MELKNFTIEELNDLESQIKVQKASLREKVKNQAKAVEQARYDKFHGNIEEGDTISFLYGRENEICEGEVIRVSAKSVTVKSEAFVANSKEGKDTNYVRYNRIVEILETNEAEDAVENFVEEAAV